MATLTEYASQLMREKGITPEPGETAGAFIARVTGKTVTYGGDVPMTGTPVSVAPAPVQPQPTPRLISTTQMPVPGPVPVKTGDPVDVVQAGLPAAVPAALAGIGIPASLIAGLGTAYGLSQMIGVQYPWETGPGEGFIAPWTRDIVQDEQGKWVTRETRPDLFANGAAPGAVVPAAGMFGVAAPSVVKTWMANGWPFAMTSDGYIHTVTKSGLRRRWKPYRSVVLGKNPSTRMISKAVTKLVAFDKVHERIKKLARRLKT